ncbi:uncharacterized protein LTR77_005470 [Saxophila tyrrhenica]|uniref:MYND-type domain-containing protein n=1 Tax=Saxophila tyrrhenica TaxID=1690608 RepID=A0AAV9PC16_9PEZI|nr:hypothetical protein LTR77_005470 [Saxophila tyrrhenica]
MDRSLNACLRSLEDYIKERLAVIKTTKANDGLEAAKKEYAKMTPMNFKIFLKQYRAEQAALYAGKGWNKILCPVKVSGDGCERCGAVPAAPGEDGHGGSRLLSCGKCRKVLYCNRACQKEDWKAHKPFCK